MSKQLFEKEKSIEETQQSIEDCLENIATMWGEMSDYFDTITKLDKTKKDASN